MSRRRRTSASPSPSRSPSRRAPSRSSATAALVTTTTGTADQTTFTFSPTSALTAGDECTGTIDRTKVTDNDPVDPPDNPAADYSFSFTLDSAPAVASTDPADNATGVPADQVLTVTFSEPVTVSQSSFTLTCDGNPVAFTIGGTATAVTLTPTSDLPGTAACILTVVAAQVSDVDARRPARHDDGRRHGRLHHRRHRADRRLDEPDQRRDRRGSSGATVTVTFSEPVTADAGAFTLECPAGTPAAFTLSGSGTAVWTLTPDAKLPAAALCTLTVVGSKIHDVDAVDPPDEMAADVTVEFTIAANSAPTDLALSPATVAENQPSGTTVGTFSSTDPDAGDTFTYTLAAGPGDTDNGSFAIVGAELRTAAIFDFEAKASYSVNVRTTDSAGNVFEKSFTITVTNVNEAPTDIALSNSSVAENEPAGTVVGTLSATDQDAGQTHTFTVVTAGCGNTYPDGSSFTVNAGSLVTAAPLDYEAKSSYTVCVRVTDDGTPGLTFDELFTITVTNVNEAPVVGGDSYSGAIGNTLALRGVTATGPSTALTGALPLANDTDPEGDTLSVVAGTLATTGGGSVTINADGTFSYLPGVGDVSQTDTVTYTVTDGQLSSTGTLSIAIGADRVWWVDGAAAPGGDGRSTTPLATLTTLNGAGGAGDVDGPSDYLFVYAAPGSYAGGLALEANQRLYGQRFGLTIGGTVLVPAGVTAPTITNVAGNGVTLANGVDVQGVTVSGASADGIHGDNITTATIGSTVTVSSNAQDGIDLTGAATGSIAVAATISGNTARSVNVSNRSGGTTSFTGPITGAGIILASNTGATVTFTAPLTISSGTASAFSATGGGTVTASDTTSTLTSTTGSTLVVDSTAIGATGLKFRSVSANGAANGIRLNATGSAGGLTVLGGGNTSVGGNASGGTIQATTGPGVSLTSTSRGQPQQPHRQQHPDRVGHQGHRRQRLLLHLRHRLRQRLGRRRCERHGRLQHRLRRHRRRRLQRERRCDREQLVPDERLPARPDDLQQRRHHLQPHAHRQHDHERGDRGRLHRQRGARPVLRLGVGGADDHDGVDLGQHHHRLPQRQRHPPHGRQRHLARGPDLADRHLGATTSSSTATSSAASARPCRCRPRRSSCSPPAVARATSTSPTTARAPTRSVSRSVTASRSTRPGSTTSRRRSPATSSHRAPPVSSSTGASPVARQRRASPAAPATRPCSTPRSATTR